MRQEGLVVVHDWGGSAGARQPLSRAGYLCDSWMVAWAAGIADTLALGLLCEATGRGLPVVVLPYLSAAQSEHPALREGIERLRRLGVRVLFGPDVLPLHRPRQGKRDQFPWHLTLPALREAATH